MQQPIYVVDTNVLISYPGIIPNGEEFTPEEPTVDLSSAHIVIPEMVANELHKFVSEKSNRGKVASMLHRRLRAITEKSIPVSDLDACYKLERPITMKNGKQKLSIVPLHQNFCDKLPFKPNETDFDGIIIATTLAVIFADQGKKVDGTEDYHSVDLEKTNVTLLTNDNHCAERANFFNIRTSRYGYKLPAPYTGRRSLVVPPELFDEFWNNQGIQLEDWEKIMTEEPPLVPNEFIELKTTEYPCDHDEYENNRRFYNIGRFDADKQAIVKLRYLDAFPINAKTAGQAMFMEALMNPNIAAVLCKGPAGTGKTFIATIYSLNAVKNGEFIGISVVPCSPDNSKIGALPGDLNEKLDPHVAPIKNAIRNYLLQTKFAKDLANLKKFGTNDSAKNKRDDSGNDSPSGRSLKQKLEDLVNLDYQNWFGEPIPIEFARGRDFANEIAIYDEFQDQDRSEADTLLKRLGDEGKIIITGDIEQVHASYLDSENNGIIYACNLLKGSPLVAQISFEENEVVRHPLVAFIAKRQKKARSD